MTVLALHWYEAAAALGSAGDPPDGRSGAPAEPSAVLPVHPTPHRTALDSYPIDLALGVIALPERGVA